MLQVPDALGAQSGLLYVGDVLLAVNNQAVDSHREASAMIKKATGDVHLTIKRTPPDALTPAEVLEKAREDAQMAAEAAGTRRRRLEPAAERGLAAPMRHEPLPPPVRDCVAQRRRRRRRRRGWQRG